jgi:hypothetical protein
VIDSSSPALLTQLLYHWSTVEFPRASFAGVPEIFIALLFTHELKGASGLECQMPICAELAWNLILVGLNRSVLRNHNVTVADLIEARQSPAQSQIESEILVRLCLGSTGNQNLRDRLTRNVAPQLIEAPILFLNQHPKVVLNPTVKGSFRYAGNLA